MTSRAIFVFLFAIGCAHVEEDGQTLDTGRDDDAAAEASSDSTTDSAVSASDAAVDGKSYGCWMEPHVDTCWKCCSNVPSLADGLRAFYDHAFACYCDSHTAVECDRTCSLAKFDPTPDEECVPFFRDGVDSCGDLVPQEHRAAYEAYVACLKTCTTPSEPVH